MSAPSWPELEALFHEALARAPAERTPFLAERCAGRPDLQGEVEALLRAHERTASALEVPLTLQTQLKAGMRLGSYEVLSELGAGSMGEVYRARDTRLGRDVAVKVLPTVFLSDPERRARFEREARLLASLNHPHIAAIYGVEQAGAALALVLELVDGPTLADKIARGPLPLDQALPLAQQIAEALEAAHEKGIVHRDLKPANIKITPAGAVKVLDFGIAKASATDASGPDLSQSPSITATTPREGVILGTAAYMSPEQARGHAVDKRTDIWSFGCVLYEMLTGRQAFPGATLSDTIAAVLEREPDWHALPAHTPTLIRRLLRRSLEKDRKRRLADISDARLDIEEALTTPSSTEGLAVSHVSRSGVWRLIIALTTGLIVGGILAASVLWRTTRQPASGVTRLTMMLSGPATLNINGSDRDLAISPDGSRLVYVGARGSQLFVRAMNELDATPIASGAPRNPFFSPDGQWVGFFDGQQTIKKVAITGGPVVTICRKPPGGPRGAAWGPDGTIVFATIGPGLWAVSADGGQPAMLTMPDPQRGESNHWWPEFLPGGQAVLFTIRGPSNTFEVAVLDRRTGARKILVRDASDAHYVRSGHLVYVTAGTLRATAFDLGRLEVRGTPVPVLDDVVTTPFGIADFDIASDGTLAYVTGSAQALKRVVVWVDRHGVQEPISAPARSYTAPSLSPDGSRLALDIREQEQHVWIWNFARQTLTRFSVDRTDETYPVWTADGHRLIFASGRPGSPGVFWQTADGTGAAERLATTRTYPFLSAVSRDGSRIVFEEDADLKVLSLWNDRQVSPLVQTPFTEMNGQISPDGRWLAYQSDESGQFEIYVRPFPDVNGGRWQVSTGGGTRPLWARNGRELFFLGGARSLTPSATLMNVRITPGTSWTADTPTKLFEGNYVAAANGRTYDVSADGQRFVMIKPASEATPPSIIVVQHWLEELKAKVPVGK